MKTSTKIYGKVSPVKVGLDVTKSKEVLDKGYNICSKYGTVWVSAGTALGFIRGDGFIPHDTDIDVEMLVYPMGPKLINEFETNGFSLLVTQKTELYYTQVAFKHNQSGIIFDIYLYELDQEERILINYTESGKLVLPASFVAHLDTVEYAGTEYVVLGPQEDYCEYRYGPDWMIPKTAKASWKSDAANLTKFK